MSTASHRLLLALVPLLLLLPSIRAVRTLRSANGNEAETSVAAAALNGTAVQASICISITGFTATAAVDHPNDDIENVGSNDVVVISEACQYNPWCQGFNSLGWIKHVVAPVSPKPGYCFYLKNTPYLTPANGRVVSIATSTSFSGCLAVPQNNQSAYVQMQQDDCAGTSAQRFVLTQAQGTNSTYTIKSAAGLCLTVDGTDSTAAGNPVYLLDCLAGSQSQQFTFSPSGASGQYTLQPKATPGLCVDIEHNNSDAGARVQVWQCNNTAAQLFVLG